ncbi:DUF3221 domain-containing protein [Cohnella sp. REN36]|uniref:DUF3221 domain-containing protein n=1 Tax=Cohnella sp. REN36 TaxID=2887347 RepID=UPI001D14880A|nr:DUF3221 domain-containing protein [Cohnella sp. REN36]MCC3374386.1 YobA family protein [Cohnella sp. REN36]
MKRNLRKTTALALAGTALVAALAGCGGSSVAGGDRGLGSASAETVASPMMEQETSKPTLDGFVVRRDGGRMLVVTPVAKHFGAQGGRNEYYEAIWFTGAPSEAKVGRRVQVWTTMIDESYPGQARAERVEVADEVRPDGAKRTEAEAIRAALESPAAARYARLAPVVKSVAFDAASSIWTVEIAGGGGEGMAKLRVDDRTGRADEKVSVEAPAGSPAEMYALAMDAFLTAAGVETGSYIRYAAVVWGERAPSVQEQQAVLAALGAMRGVEAIAATLEQLKEDGKTDESGGLPDGVLLKVDDAVVKANQAVLTGSVYRSPKGGSGMEVALERKDGRWLVTAAKTTWIS